jgi:hypothetical protein
MAETRNAFVTVCFPPEEVPVLEFAAKEAGKPNPVSFTFWCAINCGQWVY